MNYEPRTMNRHLTTVNLLLQIQPVIHLKHNCPVLILHERIREVIVCVDKKDIAHGFETPL
jgi:hypothetical protein